MKTYGIDPYSLGLNIVYTTNDYCLCNCEFHDDKTASMAFYYENGNYYCFACGEYGDVHKLAKKTGGYINSKLLSFIKTNNIDFDNQWFELTKLNINPTDEYLINRGITSEQIVKFNIKSDDEKIVIPFYTDDKITGIKMRWKKPKGKNKYMNFGKQPLLFGDSEFKDNDVVLVVEGVLGYFLANKYNIKCISTLSANRVYNLNDIFSNYENVEFRVMFDPDNAGYFGASKLLYLNRMNKNVFGLLDFYDVDEMTKEQFEEVIKTCKKSKDFFTYNDKYDTINNKDSFQKSFNRFINKQLNMNGNKKWILKV